MLVDPEDQPSRRRQVETDHQIDDDRDSGDQQKGLGETITGHCVVRLCSWSASGYFFLFTSCLISSFPSGLCAEMMMAAVPSLKAGMLQRMTDVPSAAVLPLKMTRG